MRVCGIVCFGGYLGLMGCEPSPEDLVEVVEVNDYILSGIDTRLDEVEEFLGQRHSQGDGSYKYLGCMDAVLPFWESGQICMDGVGEVSDNGALIVSELDLTYDQVVQRGLTLNGDIAALLQLESNEGALSLYFEVQGILTISGEIQGDVELDYTRFASAAVGPDYTGTVGGTDVSELPF